LKLHETGDRPPEASVIAIPPITRSADTANRRETGSIRNTTPSAGRQGRVNGGLRGAHLTQRPARYSD
jgi:hypothetical protein